MRKKIQIEIEERYCDICGSKSGYFKRSCQICRRDLCEKHQHWEDQDGHDVYCIECWKIGEPYRKQIEIIREDYDNRVEGLEEAWREKAREILQKKEKKSMREEEKKQIFEGFHEKIKNQKGLDPKAAKVVNDNFKDLIR